MHSSFASLYFLLLLNVKLVASFSDYSNANRDSMVRSHTSTRAWGVLERIETTLNTKFPIFRLFLQDDGVFPNNPEHPLLLFQSAFTQGDESEGAHILTNAGWTSPWVWGIFPYHHYHSTAWEILVCVRGQADVQLGGDGGPTVSVDRGDIALIPPGVAHKQIRASPDFALLGSYPPGSGSVDVLKGKPTDAQRQNIGDAIVPESEPITGIRLQDLY